MATNKVQLAPEEFLVGAVAACYRRIRSHLRGKRDRWNHSGRDVWSMEIESTLAEIAVAKFRGVYWTGQEGESAKDVLGYEVRQTPYDNGHLLIHQDDDDEARYVLVTGQLGTYIIRGWLYGREAKKPRYWGDTFTRTPQFAVPQGDLWEFEEDE